ncbi:MAG TPA: hypothetical protein VNN07_07225 [Candidatus Tectomicrobia bacterium]|nr:hypothetical protein [Candidatus Tectomicrobia bacterium]
MPRPLLVALALAAVAGCSGATLPYTPEVQPAGADVSAAYRLVGDRLQIEIDPDGRHVEEVVIVRPDGSEVRAVAVDLLPRASGGGPYVGIGLGGGSFGGRGGIGVGTGVSVAIPPSAPSGGDHLLAYFPLDQVGPAPWRVRVRLAGAEPVVILVGAAR